MDSNSGKINSVDKALIALAFIALVFSFTARFDFTYIRLFGSIWNLGHIVAFYLWTYLSLRFIKPLQQYSLLKQFIVLVIATCVFGVFIEFMQLAVGRSAEINDILSDVSGCILALLFHSNKKSQLGKKNTKVIVIVIILFLLVLHKNIFQIPVNDYYTYQQFPVLIDPQTPFEITKLDNESLSSLKKITVNDESYFQLIFSKAEYSTVMMGYFPLDWSDYEYLEINLYNPEDQELEINCRIHDLPHLDNDQVFDDRFNRTFILEPGNNQLQISVNEILNSPVSRKLNSEKMASVGLFTIDSKEEREIHLLKMKLINTE